jgi:hypothetical protein
MWPLENKGDISIRSEILHDIHNLSPVEVVLAEDQSMTAQSQLIEEYIYWLREKRKSYLSQEGPNDRLVKKCCTQTCLSLAL